MRRILFWALIGLALATPARAQLVFETVGNRAMGMGGAFVAVADDASAAWWNPAGLAKSLPASMTIEWARLQTGDRSLPPQPGPSARQGIYAAGGSAQFGASYAALQTTNLVTISGVTQAETLKTTAYGLTLLQSVAQGVIVGSTLKLERGFSASAPTTAVTAADALRDGAALNGNSVTRFDFDVGILIDMDAVRIGVSTRNLREPSFPGTAGTAITLKRETRLGVAVLPTSGLTLALDVDLDTVDLRGGLRRMAAFGGEQRIGRRLMLRGGGRFSLEGDRRLVGTGGASVMIRRNFWLDGYVTRGAIDGDRGFGVALRGGS